MSEEIYSAYGSRAEAESYADVLRDNGAPPEALSKAVQRFRETQITLLKAVIKDMETMGMGYQDEPWWPEFCALRQKLENT